MNLLKQGLSNGLTSYQLKLIAVVIMTIDHIGTFGFELPFVGKYYAALRIVGRIAAPLFLLLIAESAKYTKNKTRFVIRLYLAGVGVGLFTAATNFCFRDSIGVFIPGNILFTFFYTALYIYMIDGILKAVKEKKLKQLLYCITGILATVIPYMLFTWTYGTNSWIPANMSTEYVQLLQDLFNSFIISPTNIDYSLMFVMLGVAFYYANTNRSRSLIFTAFCLVCYFGTMLQTSVNLWPVNAFFGYIQCLMVLALPFIFLYNGRRGRERKLFFYAYYPLHRYIISVLVYFLHY